MEEREDLGRILIFFLLHHYYKFGDIFYDDLLLSLFPYEYLNLLLERII